MTGFYLGLLNPLLKTKKMRSNNQYIQLNFSLLFFALIFNLSSIAASNSILEWNQVNHQSGSHIIVEHQPNIAKSEKEALLILPGFSDSKKKRKKQKAFFEKLGYDLYIPDYHSRTSFALIVANLEAFYEGEGLGEYKKVHVFSYIIGSWAINTFIEQNGQKNIKTIIYDRSPLQERAPEIVVKEIPLIGEIRKGKVLADFSKIPYPVMERDSINIGIIVESKATKLMKFFRKKIFGYGPIRWDATSFQQRFDDLIYTPLNHTQMYTRFDIIGPDIIHFLEHGQFRKATRRIPYTWDFFEKWKGE